MSFDSLIRKQLDSMAIYWVNLEKVTDECLLKGNALKQTEIRKASGNVSCVMKAIEFNLFKFSWSLQGQIDCIRYIESKLSVYFV